MKNRRSNSLAAAAVIAVLAPIAYFGGYYILLADDPYSYDPSTGDVVPIYRIDNVAVRVLFRPAHICDRQLRPRFWEPPP